MQSFQETFKYVNLNNDLEFFKLLTFTYFKIEYAKKVKV